MMYREAEFYQKDADNRVSCLLCPHFCQLQTGQTGLCRSRTNSEGTLLAVNYGEFVGGQVDPIEKKPLYHFRPGSVIYSLGPNSCNLSCDFCQNYEISQYESRTFSLTPEELKALLLSHDLHQVAFTYTEPLTSYEFILDFSVIAPTIDIVLVSNGFINPEPLGRILPFVKAMNIDLKAMIAEFYKNRCGGGLEPVLESIRSAHAAGIHLELTNLLIPGANDSPAEIEELISFCAELDPCIPLHFSAYHPAFRANERSTPEETVINACKQAIAMLQNVYAGNLPGDEYRDSLCQACEKTLIKRHSNRTESQISHDGHCPHCGQIIYGVF